MKKGVSLIILVLSLMILSIFVGVITISGISVFRYSDASKLSVDISTLQALVRTYEVRNSGNLPFIKTTFDTTNLNEEQLEQFEGETILDNKIELYVIELDLVDAEETNYGKLENGEKDRYLYSKTTKKVYYEKGLVENDKTYYYFISD